MSARTLWTVIVERADLPALRYEDQSGHRAFDRAHALCELHGCQFTQDDATHTLTVHAGRYYQRPDERIRPGPEQAKRAAERQRIRDAYHERGLRDDNAPIDPRYHDAFYRGEEL